MSLVLKLISYTYFLRMKLCKITGMGIRIYENKGMARASNNFYTLTATFTINNFLPRYFSKEILSPVFNVAVSV